MHLFFWNSRYTLISDYCSFFLLIILYIHYQFYLLKYLPVFAVKYSSNLKCIWHPKFLHNLNISKSSIKTISSYFKRHHNNNKLKLGKAFFNMKQNHDSYLVFPILLVPAVIYHRIERTFQGQAAIFHPITLLYKCTHRRIQRKWLWPKYILRIGSTPAILYFQATFKFEWASSLIRL